MKPRSKKQAGRVTGTKKGRGPRATTTRGTGPRSGGASRGGAVRSSGGRGDSRSSRPDKRELGGTQVEGRQAVREMLIAQRRRVFEILLSNELDENDVVADILELASAQRVPVRRVPRREIDRVARSEAPQGIVAMAAGLPEVELGDLIRITPGKQAPFVVAIDGVTDPGNLGAILRSCDGAGVDGVVLPRHRAVHVTPTAAKSAAGAVEYVPMAIVGGLPTALKQMKEAGMWIVGLHDAADKTIFELGDLANEPLCLVMGAEGPGLSRLVRERCDVLLSIPMHGSLSSLNVSAATALATYEVLRIRAQA